jgi:hypothetical protein
MAGRSHRSVAVMTIILDDDAPTRCVLKSQQDGRLSKEASLKICSLCIGKPGERVCPYLRAVELSAPKLMTLDEARKEQMISFDEVEFHQRFYTSAMARRHMNDFNLTLLLARQADFLRGVAVGALSLSAILSMEAGHPFIAISLATFAMVGCLFFPRERKHAEKSK